MNRPESTSRIEKPAVLMAPSSATTIRHKMLESEALADQVAAFRRKGGRVEILGNTPLRPAKNRREVIQVKGSNKSNKAPRSTRGKA